MSFSSVDFLLRFLPLFVVVYYIVPAKFRNIALLLGSIVFYALGDPYALGLLLIIVLVNYVLVGLSRNTGNNKLLVAAGALDILVLLLFKVVASPLQIGMGPAEMSPEMMEAQTMNWRIFLTEHFPPGLGFICFQMVLMLKEEKDGRSFGVLEFGNQVMLFPHLVSGPFLRYEEMAPQYKSRKYTHSRVESGFQLFTIGLGMKLLLANRIGALWTYIRSVGAAGLGVGGAWLGAIAFSLQLYFDFQGYTLMAIGLGRVLGFELPRNFRDPYQSVTVSDFYRRWHITLGAWFRDLVYIPMGGNRVGAAKLIRNLLAVWVLTALWHGLEWHYLIWGLVLFALIVLEKVFYGKFLEKHAWLGHIYILVLIPITWVIFAIGEPAELGRYLLAMVGVGSEEPLFGTVQLLRNLKSYGVFLAAGVLFSTNLPERFYTRFENRVWMKGLLLLLLLACIIEVAGAGSTAFLYGGF